MATRVARFQREPIVTPRQRAQAAAAERTARKIVQPLSETVRDRRQEQLMSARRRRGI